MMLSNLLFAVVPIVFAAAVSTDTIVGPLRLTDRHPDEPAAYTYHERFSIDSAVKCVGQTRAALASFAKLTDKARETLTKQEIAQIGNTEWETQNLGFDNWTGTIEGTLRKQQYLIRKLEYELAKERFEAGKIPKKEVARTQKHHKEAERAFLKFWESFSIAE